MSFPPTTFATLALLQSTGATAVFSGHDTVHATLSLPSPTGATALLSGHDSLHVTLSTVTYRGDGCTFRS